MKNHNNLRIIIYIINFYKKCLVIVDFQLNLDLLISTSDTIAILYDFYSKSKITSIFFHFHNYSLINE